MLVSHVLLQRVEHGAILLVGDHFAERDEHDEEGEQQRHHVAVGHNPFRHTRRSVVFFHRDLPDPPTFAAGTPCAQRPRFCGLFS